MRRERIVLVGAGRAAAAAAATLRREGFDGDLVVVGDEPHPPYRRPPLSKAWDGAAPCVDDLLVRDAEWYGTNAVELITGTRAVALDCASRQLTLADGARLGYDRLLLATGGRPRRLPGVRGDRIHHLRTVADAAALREQLAGDGPLVVLGGGFLGCEVAAAARASGVEVTIVEMAPTLLSRAMSPELGELFAALHRSRGVTVLTGERVDSVVQAGDQVVVRTCAQVLECAALLVAIGISRSTELLAGTPVACDDGVLVDEFAATSVPGVYAAGDVAAAHHPRYGRRVRVEHDDNAVRQATVAARNMLGARDVYDDPHWFWSDQFEHNLQMVGSPEGHDRSVVRGSPGEGAFSVFHLRGDRLVSVLAFDRGRDVVTGRKLVAAGATVAAEQLEDDAVDLRRLLRRQGGGPS
ncbi:FAD-dependent oxidoreductase [Pseudonocardia benzenivorans]